MDHCPFKVKTTGLLDTSLRALEDGGCETEDSAVVRVIRIGSLQGTCDVTLGGPEDEGARSFGQLPRGRAWYTEDFSAVAGRKYIGALVVFSRAEDGGEGILNFGPGESVRTAFPPDPVDRTFEVKIINDDNFDTALETFRPRDARRARRLGGAVRVAQDPRYKTSSVMILDDDLFPSNDFKEEIETGEEAVPCLSVPALAGCSDSVSDGLLWSFIKFCFVHVDQIWWKTILVNAYYLATIFIKVYLIDAWLGWCLTFRNDPEAEERLWIPGDRNGTAVCLGLAWVLPNIILLASDYFEMKGLEMGFNIRNHLRVNLFRKYLRYTSESRAAVPVQDLKIAIMEDIPDVVADGYLIIFELWAMLGKIGMVTIFMLKKTPGDRCRMTHAVEKKTIVVRHFEEVRKREVCRAGARSEFWAFQHLCAEDSEEARDGLEKLQLLATWLAGRRKGMGSRVAWMESELFYRVDGRIGVDDRIGVDGGEFQPNSEALAPGKHEQGGVAFPNMANSQLIPWITLLAIGFYIGGSAQMVLGGRISLGALVTTINIYKDRQNSRGRGHALKKKQLISESKEKNWREELPSPKITSAAVLACPDFFKRPAISQAVDVCCWRPEHNSGIV
ncbi:unnamed protein product [Durusdinium trenchii]|uniref:Uncharacterized protein n=1 Tax=Durusdinium trenchii TaxID=1381693 RepID=A0ABP0SEU9_9DINO